MYILLNNKLFPQILKLFILVVFIFFIYFSNYIKGKEVFGNNIQYNQNNTNNNNNNKNTINNNTNNNNKNNYNNTVHLSLSIDDKYFYPCIVFLTSLLDNRANSTFYIIHLLTNNNLSKENMEKIDIIIKRFGNNSVNLFYYNIEGNFKNATKGYFSVLAYYKILLPSLLPNVDKIISIDGDMLNLEDLYEMYSIELKENMYFGGITDYINHLDQLKQYGLSSDKYINSGVLLMNLKAIRDNSIEKKIKEFIATHYCRFGDQTAINCVCYNNIQILSYKYNLFAFPSIYKFIELNRQQDIKYRVRESELNEIYNKPTLLHYVSLGKPWLKQTTKFNRVYWWYYAKMSGFYQEILDYYKFDKTYIEELLKQIPEDGGLLRRNYKKLN